jgi:hypothetical protein
MRSLLVQVLAVELPIGSANLNPSDASMGVASGVFHPNANYVTALHSRACEQRELKEVPVSLSVRSWDGTPLSCEGVDLIDFAASVGVEGRELAVLGLADFQALFGHVS